MELGRTELKFRISNLDCIILRKKLLTIMKYDSYAQNNGSYIVKSLYFDNFKNKILMEKINGTDSRIKFRIRYYNNQLNIFFLEKKSKEKSLCKKEKCQVNPMEIDTICNGNISWMLHDNRKLIRELYINMTLYKLKPQTIVSYKREAFIYPYGNVRITLDSDVQTTNNTNNIFRQNIVSNKVNDEEFVILEIKYDEYLPDIIKGLVQLNDRRTESISKYMQCRIYG